MATNKHGNIIFTTAAADFLTENRIIGMVVHCTHGSTAAVVVLTNGAGASGNTLFSIEVPAADDFADFDFSARPLYFPAGIGVKTLSNAELTIITDKNKDKGY